MKRKSQRYVSDGAAKYCRWSILQGIKQLYKQQSIAITAPRFSQHWTRMSNAELLAAYEYAGAVLAQSPVGSGWNDMEFSPRIVASTFEGAIWTVNIGFTDRSTATAFANNERVQGACVLNTQPRKGKRTNCPWEVKLWSPDVNFLDRLASRELAARGAIAA
ncbi:MAG: hypothetical protein AAF810_01375 [Cyanobacteria bacterium P01_D01_bin.36]